MNTTPTPLGPHPVSRRRRRTAAVLIGLGLVVLASCGSDDSDSTATTTDQTTATTDTTPETDPDTTAGTEPDTSEPDTTEPDTTEPDTTEPDTSEPDTSEPDTSEPDSTGPATPSSQHQGHDGPMVTIGLRDYVFEDVPASVPLGTTLSINNSSSTEVHELVAVLLPADETRSASELVTLAPAELGALIGAVEPEVLIAPPGEAGFAAVGDGVLDVAGRYLLLCSIPIGADPSDYLAALQAGEGPPEVAGGPPHFTAGMFGEIVVEPGA